MVKCDLGILSLFQDAQVVNESLYFHSVLDILGTIYSAINLCIVIRDQLRLFFYMDNKKNSEIYRDYLGREQ